MQTFRRIAAVVMFAAGVAFSFAQTATNKPATKSPAALAIAPKPNGLVDINTASVAQLKALPGLGDVYINRIIKGRPYATKNQLVSRGVIPASAYARVQDMIIAKQAKK